MTRGLYGGASMLRCKDRLCKKTLLVIDNIAFGPERPAKICAAVLLPVSSPVPLSVFEFLDIQ
jgi:hypothetical protein